MARLLGTKNDCMKTVRDISEKNPQQQKFPPQKNQKTKPKQQQ